MTDSATIYEGYQDRPAARHSAFYPDDFVQPFVPVHKRTELRNVKTNEWEMVANPMGGTPLPRETVIRGRK